MKAKIIKSITDKIVNDNVYLTVDDATRLFEASTKEEFEIIKEAADTLRKKLVGDKVSYTINQNVNFTDRCESKCLFCGFRKDVDDEDAFVLDLDELYDKLKVAVSKGAMEICLQGGLNSSLEIPGINAKNHIDLYAKLLIWVKDHFPSIITHSYSPEEIDFISYLSGRSIGYTIEYLKDSGLDTMPGTAAEILVDDIRKKICPKKLNTARWIEIVKQAHKFNIPTTATIMYGHIETPKHQAIHLDIIRNIQNDTGKITEFIPLPLIATKTSLAAKVAPLSTEQRLRMLAVGRLFFADTIPNIQASWVKQGMDEVLESLSWGVNDVGGTLGDEMITYAAGGGFGRSVESEDLVNIIIKGNKKPVLRDTYYNYKMSSICVA